MNEVRIVINMHTSGASCRNKRANRCNAAGSVVGDVPVSGGEGEPEHVGDHLERHGRHPQPLNPTGNHAVPYSHCILAPRCDQPNLSSLAPVTHALVTMCADAR